MTVNCDRNKISGVILISNNVSIRWKIALESCLSFVDESGKFAVINYGGNFGGEWEKAEKLKEFGFYMQDANGNNLNFETYDYCRMKIPFSNISDITEMHFHYKDQEIKTTISI